jgi:ABC-2 type transport system ATP-binding protein
MSAAILEAEGLTKRYGALTAVDGLSLAVNEGEIFGFLGPNGAGKTTSIGLLCGLLKADAGSVRIQGEVMDGGSQRVRARVGLCPQEIVVWERLTCLEQLVYMGSLYDLPETEARRKAEGLLEALGLAEKRSSQARTLSGGMRRRLNLCLALVHDPALVVLDEPEAGLDPQSRVRVRDFIRSLARSKTVILTTHNMDEAERLADRVAIIDHGKLLVQDTPAALCAGLGSGDVLEIGLKGELNDPEQRAGLLREALLGRGHTVNSLGLDAAERAVRVRALDAVQLLPDLLAALQAMGLQPGEVRLRPNTLEDVFIQLTGRSLRE